MSKTPRYSQICVSPRTAPRAVRRKFSNVSTDLESRYDALGEWLAKEASDAMAIAGVLDEVCSVVPFGNGPEARVSAALGEVARRHPGLLLQLARRLDEQLSMQEAA